MTGLAGAKIGMYATASTQSAAVPITASFDWFKLTAPTAPSDEFDGDGLNLCRWNAIVRHDPSGLEVADGKLTLPAAHGDFFAAGVERQPEHPPPGDAGRPWTMETRMTFMPNENYEQAGLLVYGDDANYVKADLVHAERPRGRVPARGQQRRERVRRHGQPAGRLPADDRPADRQRRGHAAGVLPAGG